MRSPPGTASRLAAAAAALAFPRLTGSPGATAIRKLLGDKLKQSGLGVREETFQFNPQRPLLRVRIGLLVIAASLVLDGLDRGGVYERPTLTARFFGLLCGFVFILIGFSWNAGLFLGHDGLASANILGRIGNPAGGRAVFVAHHDSKSQWPPLWLRCVLLAGGVVGLAAFLLHLSAVSFGWTLPQAALPAIRAVLVCGGGMVACLACFTIGNRSPGALDNGAALAVLLEVAHRLGSDPPQNREVVFAFTGGEEHLMAGGRVLANEMSSLWKDGRTEVLNLDGVGAPGPLGLHGNREIVRRLQGLAAGQGMPTRRLLFFPGWFSDAMPLGLAGLRVGSLTSGRLGRAAFAVHTRRDQPVLLDPGNLAATADLLEAWARDASRS